MTMHLACCSHCHSPQRFTFRPRHAPRVAIAGTCALHLGDALREAREHHDSPEWLVTFL